MQPMTTIRGWQIDQLKKAVPTIQYLMSSVTPEALTTFRDGGSGWTALEVLCHLRDIETFLLPRAKLTIEQDNPLMPFRDAVEMAEEGDYNNQDIAATLNAWSQARLDYVRYLEAIDEAGWERTAQHPRRGPMTLDDQVIFVVWHDLNHIEQIARVLMEKRTS